MTDAAAPIRVLIADDHPVFRDGLASLLSTQPGVEIVATAADGAEAVALAMEHRPDVVVMDLQMPELTGIEATRRLTADLPDTRVLVLTMGEEDGTVLAAMRAGARGYLVKGAGQAEVKQAINTVHAGGLVFGAALALRIADLLSGAAAPSTSAFPQLTERELEILDLVAAGRNNAQIAQELYLAPKTVRNNVSNILAKLQATDRADAIIRARDAGLGGAGGGPAQ
jgi:DNA-binding NarL/FixJ family response regulator